MKKLLFSFCCLLLTTFAAKSDTARYRLTLRGNPSSTMTIGWDQVSGSRPKVYYGTTDYGTDYSRYPNSQSPDREVDYRGMDNRFVRLSNLRANTAYYFVIRDSRGTSERFWFRTSPSGNERLSFIAGGDSRNNRTPRRDANLLVSKLKPHAVFFGGDMTDDDRSSQWISWFNDWQLTIASDGRMFPIVAARGNHESSNRPIYNLFDVPSSNAYYAITFGRNLIRAYTLNTETSISGSQTDWLEDDLNSSSANTLWKMAQYHKPMRPHVRSKSEGNSQYNSWARLFYDEGVRLVVECDAHSVKTTWPIRPSSSSGNDEGFKIDNAKGTVYAGEGCWGAPLRSSNDSKDWTRNSGTFNQFKWIWVDQDNIEIRTVKVDNADEVSSVSNSNPFSLPRNIDLWEPSNGTVVTIERTSGGGSSNSCSGVAEFDSNGRYSTGDRVVFEGSLFERTSSGWDQIGSCSGAKMSASFNKASDNKFTMYPNPFKNEFTLMNANKKAKQLILADITGKVVLKEHIELGTNNINTESLEKEISYFLILLEENGTIIETKRIVKN